jgi:3-oxoacyl-[acyl-carrier-protein] synthase II
MTASPDIDMAHSASKRVVITGLGVVAPNGIGKEAFWSSLLEGQSGIGPITLFDAARHPCQIAGEVKNFDLRKVAKASVYTRRLSRQDEFALAAAIMAVRDAGLDDITLAPNRSALLYLGISCPAVEVISRGFDLLNSQGPAQVPPYIAPTGQPHHTASTIAACLPMVENSYTLSSACAAGADAIALGAEQIRLGRARMVLVGGADAPINALTYASLAKAGLLTKENQAPEKASRPFDARHDAGIISEGAGMLMLELYEHALLRGARIYAELTGHAACPDPDPAFVGSGLETAMPLALASAFRRPDDVDYICAHGPSHRELDRNETKLIKQLLGKRAYSVPVSSIKAVIGNPLAAAGPMQLIAVCMAMTHDLVPPTANLELPDPECDLDYVPNRPRRSRLKTVLINVHGLGGGNTCLVVERMGA